MKKYRISLLLILPLLISLACGSLQNVPTSEPEAVAPIPTDTAAPAVAAEVSTGEEQVGAEVSTGEEQVNADVSVGDSEVSVEVAESGTIPDPTPTSEPAPQESSGDSGQTDTGFPVMSDSSNVSLITSNGHQVLSYETNHVVEDVVDFYKEQMAAAGWQVTKDVAIVVTGPAIIEFSRSGDDVELMASPIQNNDGTGVVLNIGTGVTFESDGGSDSAPVDLTADFEFPMLEDATATTVDANFLGDTEQVYITSHSTSEVVNFYKEQMADLGFVLVSEATETNVVTVIFLGFANVAEDLGIVIGITTNPLNVNQTIVGLVYDHEILNQ